MPESEVTPPPLPPSLNPIVKTSGLAIAALTCGIVSWCCCLGPLTAIPAIICGIMALTSIEKSHGLLKGKGFAIAGLVLGGIAFVLIPIYAAIMLPALARARESARRASCQNNLKELGIVFKKYAADHKGSFPELSSTKDHLMCQADSVYPTYLGDLAIMICPSNPDIKKSDDPKALIDDQNYFYLGYVLENDKQVQAFLNAYKESPVPPAEALNVARGEGNQGGHTIYRLRERLEKNIVPDFPSASAAVAESEIPVIIEPPEHHVPAGGNVLFLDGHVEFMRYPGKWPMTTRTIGALEALHKGQ